MPWPDQRQSTEADVLIFVITARITARLEHDYPRAEDRAAARALVERIPAELSVWREVSEGDRVEAAALTAATGDLAKLGEAVELALRDWRDLLLSVEYQ